QLRHTSFALVEVLPKFKEVKEFAIPEDDIDVQFSKSSGPGGQNVNKRETAVRILHIPTNISVHADSERTQERNREKALEILKGKLFHRLKEERKEEISELSKTPDSIEWGNQIRSYVLHPYKMVKDHRTEAETSNIEAVLDGDIGLFIDASKALE
ncbi:MAG: peptide chain release factor-like protein, partial [Candidatus Paceibacterota bacterium]